MFGKEIKLHTYIPPTPEEIQQAKDIYRAMATLTKDQLRLFI